AALVPRALAAFRAEHPGVVLSLTEGLTPELVTALRDGELDLAVLSMQPGRSLNTDGLTLRPLLDDPLMIAIPREHRFAAPRTLRLAELADEQWIAGSASPEDTLIGACLRSGFQPHVHFVAPEWIAKPGLVAA